VAVFNTFLGGDLVLNSGVYAVMHSTPHTLMERELYIVGSYFQRCRFCPFGVAYRLENPSVRFSLIPQIV
jgi:hypothetical protein